MVEKAKAIVREYVLSHFDLTALDGAFDVYVVWQVKALRNWKFLISTDIPDGMYYQLTYNGYEREWYLDAYMKTENVCIRESLNEH